jgi:hypothetical protein
VVPDLRVVSVGLGGIEPPTSALSVLRSNRLSYSPGIGNFERTRRSHVRPLATRGAAGVATTRRRSYLKLVFRRRGHPDPDTTHDLADEVVNDGRKNVGDRPGDGQNGAGGARVKGDGHWMEDKGLHVE